MNTSERLQCYDLMVKSRCLEERFITMFKTNQGFFWIGGPGEEAFSVALGLHVKKGQGLGYDYLHLHYRSSAILVAMGLDLRAGFQQMANTASDPFSGGRNFCNHYAIPEWNVVPVTSTIETQYLTAIGTAIAQREGSNTGITIVNGGDAGTAEGDFASCLVWASRPQQELPILILVMNNQWGISTSAASQHGESSIADRGKAFGIKTVTVNGNDLEASYTAIQEAIAYIRETRKPVLMEAHVSRLYGHSSASGASFHAEEEDPITTLENDLLQNNVITPAEIKETREKYDALCRTLAESVQAEAQPDPQSIYDHTYWKQKGKYW